MAVHCGEVTEPAIARIRTINEDTLNVIWLKGGYSKSWAPCIL